MKRSSGMGQDIPERIGSMEQAWDENGPASLGTVSSLLHWGWSNQWVY